MSLKSSAYLFLLSLVLFLYPFTGNAQLRQIPDFPLLKEPFLITYTGEIDKGIVFVNIANSHVWFSDGTAEGTLPLLQTCDPNQEEIITEMETVSGKVYFSCESVVYATDGTPAGTQMIFASHTTPHNYVIADSSCYFLAAPGSTPVIIQTNGTAAGTKQIALQYKPNRPYPYYNQLDLIAYKGWLYYILGYESPNFPKAILLSRINVKDNATEDLITLGYHTQLHAKTGVLLNSSLVVNERLIVGDYNDTLSRFRIWKSEGAGNDFILLKEFNGIKGIPTLYPTQDHFMFQALGQLWSSDGTEEGTLPLKDGSYTIFSDAQQTYLYGADGLWLTDGTPANTVSLYNAGTVANPVRAGDLLFFRVTAGGVNSIWRTDGTTAGTFMVKDKFTGSYKVGGNLLFFTYNDVASGNELWASDGSIGGTIQLKDFNPGNASSDPAFLFNIKDRVYFTVNVPDPESTGTPAGLVKQLWVYDPVVTGIQGENLGLQHLLFPNPASKTIQVPDEITHGRIINSMGEMVGAYVPGSGMLDVSALPSGMYFFVYENEGRLRRTEKFQVVR